MTEVRILGPSGKFGPPSDEDVFAVDVETGASHRLTGLFDAQALGPASYAASWWPDGSRLFFRTVRSNLLWQMNADGTCRAAVPRARPRPVRPAVAARDNRRRAAHSSTCVCAQT